MQGRGQGFESPCLHPVKMKKLRTLGAIAIYFAFLLLITPAIYPTSLNPDRGIFESVAYRLLAGDVLYLQVWDNKDPLFYFLNSLVLNISPIGDLILEMFLFLLLSTMSFHLMKTTTLIFEFNFIISFVLLPLIVIEFNYFPGYTHLPGQVLLFAIISSIFLERNKLAGVLLGFLLFTKILFFPIATLIIIYLKFRNHIRTRDVFISFVISVSIITLLLIIREEFKPWVNSLFLNYFYAIESTNKIERLWSLFDIRISFYLLFTIGILVLLNIVSLRSKILSKEVAILNTLSVSTFLVLLLTGKHDHHLQILVPLVLITLFNFIQLLKNKKVLLTAFTSTALVYFFLVSQIFDFDNNFERMKWYLANDKKISTEADALLENAQRGKYARLGQNDDNAHAKGLSNWELACPRFHQYPFEDSKILIQTKKCLGSAEYLIISPTFKEYSTESVWNEFVRLTMIEVEDKFICNSYTTTRICKNTISKDG